MSPQTSTEGSRLTANVSKSVHVMALLEVPLPRRLPGRRAMFPGHLRPRLSTQPKRLSIRRRGSHCCTRLSWACVCVSSLCHAIPAAHSRLSPLQPQLRSPLTSGCCGSFCLSLPCRPSAPTAVAAVPCVCTEVLSERHSVTAYRQVPPLQQDVKFTTRNTAVITAPLAWRRVLPGSRQTWSMSECVNGC